MAVVAAAMTREMLTNAASGTAAGLALKFGSWRPDWQYEALARWRDLVGNGRPWDHKRVLRRLFGDWALDAATATEFNYDIWSNVHYGFVGRCCGMSSWLLLNGAGYAQWSAGTAPEGYWRRRFETLGDADSLAAFDDPDDQTAIRLGIKLWQERRHVLGGTELEEAARRATGLKTRPATP